MDPEILALLDLPNDASEDQKTAAYSDYKKKLVADKKKADDDKKKGPPPPPPNQEAAACPPDQMLAAASLAVKPMLGDIVIRATLAVKDEIRQELATQKADEDFEKELLAAEKDKKIVAADVAWWRTSFKADREGTRKQLAARPTSGIPDGWYEGGVEIHGTDHDQSLSIDKKPQKERDEILSRTAAWMTASSKGYEAAFVDVRKQSKEERDFHAQVLRSNPDWGRDHEDTSDRRGAKWRTRMGPGLRAMDIDYDRVKHILGAIKQGKLDSYIPEEVRKTLAGEAGDFQPDSRFPVSGFGYGIYQGEFGGSEMAPDVMCGANEEAYYPIYGNEALRVKVGPNGLPVPIGRLAEDKPSSTRRYEYRNITLHGYGNCQWIDRRDQAAGDAILPIGVLAQAGMDSVSYAKNEQELLQSATMRDSTKYLTANVRDFNSSGRAWNLSTGTPIPDHKGARMQIWRKTGVNFTDIMTLMGPDVVETLTLHPSIVKAAQVAGVGHLNEPRAAAPVEVLLALFGNIVMPTCRITTNIDGSDALSPWGQDVIMAVVSKGKVIAPRAFATVRSAGYPLVRSVSDDRKGLRGADGADHADMYSVIVAGPASPGTTSSAFLFQNVCPELDVVA